MIELRPFAKLGGADHGWLKAKHHFSFASYYDPANMGHGALRVWNDDEIAPNTGFPAASPRQHGDHHLCPRRRDHPSGQPRQQGPHRGRRRAGDERRHRHPPLRIQSGADQDPDLPDLDRADERRRPADLGRQAVSEVGPLRQARDHRQRLRGRQGRAADPRRRAGAGHHAEGRRERGIRAGRSRATSIWCRRRARSKSTACASTPATAPRSATKRSSGSPRWKIPNWCWSTRRSPLHDHARPCAGHQRKTPMA